MRHAWEYSCNTSNSYRRAFWNGIRWHPFYWWAPEAKKARNDSPHSPWRATKSVGFAGVKPLQKIDAFSSPYQSSMEVFWSRADTCVISIASVMGMRLCQYKISISDMRLILSLVGKELEILVSVPSAGMKNKMVKKYEIQLFNYFWLKMWIFNKEKYPYEMFNVGLPNSHGAGGALGFFEHRWRFFTRILNFPRKWLKHSWNTSITLKWH